MWSDSIPDGIQHDNFCIIKLDSLGEIKWHKMYRGISDQQLLDIWQTTDRGYVISGDYFSISGDDFYILKIDSIGNIEWTNGFGGSLSDEAYSIKQTDDKGYILSGHTWSFGMGERDFLITKVDSIGNVEWSKTFGESNYREEECVIELTTDNGYILGGKVTPSWVDSFNFLMIKLDAVGNVEWSIKIKQPTYHYWYPNVIRQVNNQEYLLGGNLYLGTGNIEFILIKVESNGIMPSNCLYQYMSPSTTSPAVMTAVPTITATTSMIRVISPTPIVTEPMITKTVVCESSTGIEEKIISEKTYLYTKNNISRGDIEIYYKVKGKEKIEVINIIGNVIEEFEIQGKGKILFNTLPTGIYFIKAQKIKKCIKIIVVK